MAVSTQNIGGGNIHASHSQQIHWFTLISGGMNSADAAPITDPASEITASTRFLTVPPRGTSLVVRLKYDDGITFSTDPIIQVFGANKKSNGTREYFKLFNENGSHTVTIAAAETTDVSDGTDNWTDTIKNAGNAFFDMLGASEILVGVNTAAAVSAGDVTLVSLEGKVV